MSASSSHNHANMQGETSASTASPPQIPVSMLPVVCVVCHVPSSTRCGRCRCFAYCGAAHQREHWETGGHRTVCRRIDWSTVDALQPLQLPSYYDGYATALDSFDALSVGTFQTLWTTGILPLLERKNDEARMKCTTEALTNASAMNPLHMLRSAYSQADRLQQVVDASRANLRAAGANADPQWEQRAEEVRVLVRERLIDARPLLPVAYWIGYSASLYDAMSILASLLGSLRPNETGSGGSTVTDDLMRTCGAAWQTVQCNLEVVLRYVRERRDAPVDRATVDRLSEQLRRMNTESPQ